MLQTINNLILDVINLIRIDILGNADNALAQPMIEKKCHAFFTSRFVRTLTEQPDLFAKTLSLLADDISRTTYLSDVKNRALQTYFCSFLSDELTNTQYTANEFRRDLLEYKTSTHENHFDFSGGDIQCFVKGQYLIPGIFELEPGNVIFDIGAFTGATAVRFRTFVGEGGEVYAFEPESSNFTSLVENTKQYANIHPVNIGFSDKPGTTLFSQIGTA